MSPCQVVVPLDPWSPEAHAGAGGVDHGQAGFYAPVLGPFSIQTATALQNRARFFRVVCPKSQTITKIGFVVAVAATADDQVDVGVYNSALTTLLGSSGPTSGRLNSTGAKTVNLQAPVSLVAETVYYAAISDGVAGGTPAQTVNANVGGNTSLIGMFGSFAPYGELLQAIPLFPLSAPTSPGLANNGPILALMQ